jgi:TetR/AcrR family transcriptional regulator
MTVRGRGRPAAGDPTVSTSDLLDAALDAFAERGFDGTSVRELARGLGVSHNLIPQRIGSKDELWLAAVDQGFARLALALADVIASLSLQDEVDDLATLRAVVIRFVEVNCSRPALLRIIQQEAAAPGPRFDHLFERYIDPVRIFGGDLLIRLREAGRVRTDNVALMYFFMTHGAAGPLALPAIAERFGWVVDPSDAEAVHRHATAAVDMLFDGLVGEPRPLLA